MFHMYGMSQLRRAIVQRLAEAYSVDALSLEDYERRVTAAEQASTIDDLNAVVSDFPDETPHIRPVHPASSAKAPLRSSLHPAVWLLPTTLLLLALLPFPYGFYVMLRLIVCSTSVLLTYDEYRLRGRVSGWAIVLAGIALLFNPLIPVHLTRDTWVPIDVATGALLIFHWRRRA